MKKNVIIGLIAAMLLPFAGNAQIKVESNGQTLIGSTIYGFQTDSSGAARLRILPGKSLSGSPLGPSKIDFGSIPNATTIGEYYSINSARLDLYGSGGMYFTSKYNSTNKNFMIYDPTSYEPYGDILHINTNLRIKPSFQLEFTYGTCVSLYQSSDERYKKEVAELSNTLPQLSKLRGVTYKLDFTGHPSYGEQNITSKDPSGNEVKSVEPALVDNSKHIGFIAQELQQVFPELVKADEEGNLAINYTGLIPVIVEALKEQQAIITAQSGKINELQSEVEALRTGTTTPKKTKGTEAVDAFLYQNAPNPFNIATKIRYFLSSETNASLYIFDMQGKLIESYPLSGAGEGSVEISASGLQPGMYLYSLLVNNQEVDTKKMVITE